MYVTLFRGLTFQQYITVRTHICTAEHQHPCLSCIGLLKVARAVNEHGFIKLSDAFKLAFPEQIYKTDIARLRILQVPLASIRVGELKSGNSCWYLVPFVEGLDYNKFVPFLEALMVSKETRTVSKVTRSEIKALLGLAQSDRERELVRYSFYRASGVSPTTARRQFGFDSMRERSECVQEAIEQARQIRESIDLLAFTKDRSILSSFGIVVGDSDSDSEDDGVQDVSHSLERNEQDLPSDIELPPFELLTKVLKEARYNWFELVEFAEIQTECEYHNSRALRKRLLDLYNSLLSLIEVSEDINHLKQSYSAFMLTVTPSRDDSRFADILNGDIVSDSESDGEDYVGLATIACSQARTVIAKKRKALSRTVRRDKSKAIASANFLSRKVSVKVKTVVDKFPGIGSTIESFVRDSNVGADAWRRTGVLTFDGNRRVNKKVTFERIRTHLQKTYNHRFSHGTVVQLCIARNLRHRSAKNYRGVAKVTCRRARKGFILRYNPDCHWSGALYKGLNFVQLTDATNITILNRDDSSGYRLDTLFTNSQHRTHAVKGHETLTTHTDYVKKYKSIIQTTCYNFSASNCTGELCAGVVKAQAIYPKNLAQHYADLCMLSTVPELKPAFVNTNTNDQNL